MSGQLMFCHEIKWRDAGTYYGHFSRNTTVLRMYDPFAQPLVARVTEDPDGEYWGWFDADKDAISMMIYPGEMLVEMCFPYGTKAEEDRGRGRKIRVRVDEVREAAPGEVDLRPATKVTSAVH